MSNFDLKKFLKENKLTSSSKKLSDSRTVISEAKYEKEMRDFIVSKIGNKAGLGKMGTDSNFALTKDISVGKITDMISNLLGVDVREVPAGEKVEFNSGKVATISGTYTGIHFEYKDKIYNFKLSAGSSVGVGATRTPRDAAYYEMAICVEYNKSKGMDREEAMKRADVEESKYAAYEEHLTEVGSGIVENLPEMGSFLRQTGGDIFSPASSWPSSDGTPKTDIYGGPNHRISVKKEGGSQLISGGAGDAKGIFTGAFKFYEKYSGKGKQDAMEIVNSISDEFKRFTSERSVTDVRKGAGNAYVEWRMPQIEEKARKLNLNLNKNDAERHAKAEAISAGLIGSRGNWEGWFIDEIQPLSDKKIMKWFEDYWKSQSTDELKDEIRNIVSAAISHKKLDDAFNKIFEDAQFKKYCVYEAASGDYKFSGTDTLGSPDDPIANKLLVFSLSGKVKVKPIDEDWASKYANKVSTAVVFKSSKNSKWTSFRLISEGYNYNELSHFEKDLNHIIESESRKLSKDVNTLFENYNNDVSNIINEISLRNMMRKMKDVGRKLLKKISDKIKSFYENVIKRVISNLKKYATEGLNSFMEIIGIDVNGKASIDIKF